MSSEKERYYVTRDNSTVGSVCAWRGLPVSTDGNWYNDLDARTRILVYLTATEYTSGRAWANNAPERLAGEGLLKFARGQKLKRGGILEVKEPEMVFRVACQVKKAKGGAR